MEKKTSVAKIDSEVNSLEIKEMHFIYYTKFTVFFLFTLTHENIIRMFISKVFPHYSSKLNSLIAS